LLSRAQFIDKPQNSSIFVTVSKAFIAKINKKETGFIRLPKEERKTFAMGEQIKVTINPNIQFFAKIRKCGVPGVYVPKQIIQQHKLCGEYNIIFERTNNFSVNIAKDGRIYVPNKLGKKIHLQHDDVIKVEGAIDNQDKVIYGRVRVRKKHKTTEYMLFIGIQLANKNLIINTISKAPNKKIKSKEIDFNSLLSKYNFVEVAEDNIILYLGQRVPIIINTKISLKDVAHFLGCFFADGTKRGVDWGICASTFEQANYYKEMHSLIIPDNKLNINLTITVAKNDNKQVEKSLKLWKKNCNEDVKRVYKNFSDSKGYTNRNKFGTLVIKEHRQLTQIYYNNLVLYLLDKIKKKNNYILAQEFICGVIEGDGCLNARNRGHIQITTNDKEVKLLEEFLNCSKLEFKTHKEKNGKFYVNISGLSIIENMETLGNILFKYYPKRKNILVERLCASPTAQFIIGMRNTTSAWILKRFREKGILNEKDKLTAKGKRIRKELINIERSIK